MISGFRPCSADPAPSKPVGEAAIINDDNLLLLAVVLDQLSITDSIATYATGDQVYIPLGELSRLLDVDLNVSPSERRVTGTIGQARRPILIDLDSGIMRLNGTTAPLTTGDVVVGASDIYVRAATLERILPVKVAIDQRSLRLFLKTLEPLPIQSRLDRLGRARGLQPDVGSREPAMRVDEPYGLISAPNFDVTAAAAIDTTHGAVVSRQYALRAGADLLGAGFQGYLGSDSRGEPTTARLLLERRDPDGKVIGDLGVTRAAAGDIFTPTMDMGARSVGGRGFGFSTAPLEQANVFEQIDLRGELAVGDDVELYINDVLRGSQQQPVQGRYEFLAVPLVRGVNTIRLVFYGPHGERTEQVRVVSVGGGQLAKGKLVVEGGVEQEGRSLVTLPGGLDPSLQPGAGKLRAVIDAAYGLTSGLTVTAGFASFSPAGLAERQVATAGARTSILGFATQIDAAHDSRGGSGLSVGMAGNLFGVSTVARHAEYAGGFIDETIPGGGVEPLKRFDEASFNLAARLPNHLLAPLTVQVERQEFADGEIDLIGSARATTSLGRVLVSGGFDVDRTQPVKLAAFDRLSANLAASTNLAFQWQLRGNVDIDFKPTSAVRDISITADHGLGRNFAVRVGLSQDLETDRQSAVIGGVVWRLAFGDLSVDGNYIAPRNQWRVGLTFNFSLAYDPLRQRYEMTRSGAGSGGNLALQAFVDRNGDGKYDKGDEPVAGVVVNAGLSEVTTDARGRALLTGLGYGPVAEVRTNVDGVDMPSLASPPGVLEFTPHAGGTAVAMFPLSAQSEAVVRLQFRQANGRLVGLSAVRLEAVRDDGTHIDATTEYDGTVDFENLKPGHYRVVLDPVQSERLGMRLSAPLSLIVPPGGNPLPELTATVEFKASPT